MVSPFCWVYHSISWRGPQGGRLAPLERGQPICRGTSTPLERRGTVASQPGPYFFEEIGERTPRGRRFLPLGTPFSGGRNGGKWFRQVGAWPAASKTNASWPAHRLGRAGEVVYWRQEKMENRTVTLRLLPKGTHPRPQPAQPVGGPLQAFHCEGRRPGTKKEVQLLTTSHQRRESRGKNLFPLGFFPPFLPKKWGPGWASQGSLPFQRRRRNPATRPARSNGAGAKHKKPAAPVPGNRWFSLRSGLSHSAKLCTDPCRQSMETFIPSCRVRVAPMAPTMTALFRLRPTTAAWLPSPFSSVIIPAACRR